MANILDNIQVVSDFKHLQIRELTDQGTYYRRLIICGETLADEEFQKVKDAAEELWTDEVKDAWTTFQSAAPVGIE